MNTMKKSLLFFICIILCLGLFTACSSDEKPHITDDQTGIPTPSVTIATTPTPDTVEPTQSVPTTPSPSPTPSPTPTPTPVPKFEDIITETDEPGLYQVPNSEYEGYFLNVHMFEDRILYFFNQGVDTVPEITSYNIATGKSKKITLDDISPRDYDYKVYPGKYIVIYNGSKNLAFYDKDLNELYSFEVPIHSKYPVYITNNDCSRIYYFRNKILYECDTKTGEEKELLNDSLFYEASPIAMGADNEYLIFYAYSRKIGYYEYYLYDLTTNDMVLLDDWDIDSNYYVSPDKKEVFLAGAFPVTANLYGTGENPDDTIYLASMGQELPEELKKSSMKVNSGVEMVRPFVDWERRRVISYETYDKNSVCILLLTCYDLDTGEAVSNCTLCLEDPAYQDPGLSFEEDQGYVFIYGSIDKNTYCYAWDYVNDDFKDESTSFIRYDHIPKFLDDYRKELEKKYKIFIYLGTEIFATEHDYTLTYSGDFNRAYETLHILDETFSLYPEDVFEQLRFDGIRTMGIYLCGGFTKKSSYGIDSAVALAGFDHYERFLALDISYYGDLRTNIIHEISHWLDKKIEYYGEQTGEFDFSEVWNQNNPEGFYYMDDYNAVSPFSKYTYGRSDDDDHYFIDTYSLTYPTEDRARLFEYLMRYNGNEYFKSEHLRIKLHTYFDYLRQSFDTTNWPDETAWEYKLNMLDRMYSGDQSITIKDIYPEYYNGDTTYSTTDEDYGYLSAYTFFFGSG